MLNFTVGPVQSPDCVKAIGALDVPYFRTAEFSETMFENERLIKEYANAPINSRIVFITGSGTASMEAIVMNCFTSDDLLMVINGGGFGQRFVDLCRIHDIPCVEVNPEFGRAVDMEMLERHYTNEVTGLLVNMHETSTGVLYPMDIIGEFCKKHDLILAVDAISSFLADDFNMFAVGADVMITGSQKALACPPGVSVIVLAQRALARVQQNDVHSMYFDLKMALKDSERGQTPFTPAVGTVLQINARLREIQANGGADAEIARTRELAEDFRARINDLPLEITSRFLSNAVTPLHPLNASAYNVFLRLKDEYGIWVCPNGGAIADKIFRVGHIGNLTLDDNTALINALEDMHNRGLL